MTNFSRPAGFNLALVFFMALSVICGAGWLKAHRDSAGLAEQRIRDFEQRLDVLTEHKNVPVTNTDKARDVEQRLDALSKNKNIPVANTDGSRDVSDRVFAEVMIFRHSPQMLSDRSRFEPLEEFEYYRQTQAAMAKSPFVLLSVLRNSEIANLSLLRDQAQPLKFLEDQLEVDFPARVIMRISLSGPRSPDAVRIVNAVVTGYLNEVIDSENNDRSKRISELEKAHHELSEQLRTRRAALKKLTANLKTADFGTSGETQKMAIELRTALRKERTQKQVELINARVKLAALGEGGSGATEPDLPDTDKLRTDAQAGTQTSRTLLRDSLRVIKLAIKQLDDELEKLPVETQQSGTWALETEALQADIGHMQGFDFRLIEEIERLKLDCKARSRVMLYREATLSPDPG
jgi:hypothetical protein